MNDELLIEASKVFLLEPTDQDKIIAQAIVCVFVFIFDSYIKSWLYYKDIWSSAILSW